MKRNILLLTLLCAGCNSLTPEQKFAQRFNSLRSGNCKEAVYTGLFTGAIDSLDKGNRFLDECLKQYPTESKP